MSSATGNPSPVLVGRGGTRFPGKTLALVAIVAVLVLGAGVVRLARAAAERNARLHPTVTAVAVPGAVWPNGADSGVSPREREIALYADAVRSDPYSANFHVRLAALYLQRGRETGDYGDFQRAERNARASLKLRTQHNGPAFVTLASSLMAQHRFTDAFAIARQLVAGDPEVPQYRSLLAETQLELGDYQGAAASFDSVITDRGSLSVAPRLARWAELRGDTALARGMLVRVRREAAARSDLPPEQIAWFDLRVGDLDLRNGHLGAADSALREGLRVAPDDYRLLDAMARLSAVKHDWAGAISYGERGIATVLDPATLGIIGDAYAAGGDSAKAREYYHTMEVAVSRQPGAFHRAWSLFLLDHDRQVPRVLGRVRAEIATRRDIYGYDLLAWALHKSGRDAAAVKPMDSALSLGTQDAMLFYHAGVIAHARHDDRAARGYLEHALAVNPYFHPTQPAAARALLDSLAARQTGR